MSEYAVNDSDVFLLSETGNLRKLTLFTVEKAVEKLQWRQCYSQVRYFLVFYEIYFFKAVIIFLKRNRVWTIMW